MLRLVCRMILGRFVLRVGLISGGAEELSVRQLDGVALDDKEATVSAWGKDSGFLGGRFDFVVWDDLWIGRMLRLRRLVRR
jgi:hypothetical protein